MLTLKEAEQALANKKPFNAGNLTASYYDEIYTVRSYGVIIGIHHDGPYIFSDAYSYSQTTSKHANIAKRAWAL